MNWTFSRNYDMPKCNTCFIKKIKNKNSHFNIAKLLGFLFLKKDDGGRGVHVSPFCALIDDFSVVST